ncbi:subtilisin-like protease SBT1.4 [Papaver somniferum]|uniref:subtilisin-like protease SBT1.4 n=1 Tax=Papaver somniferum TaxID=3469 RepID=UPI000E705B07|nr:subtilisin-like protease SBT1.4 [Papaver somniferum]
MQVLFSPQPSTLDREFPCDVILRYCRIFSGVSLYSGKPLEKLETELVFAGDIGDGSCSQGNAVKIAGGLGLITGEWEAYGDGMTADSPLIPGAKVTFNNVVEMADYIRSNQKPVGSFVFKGTVIGSSPSSPKVASFSSRGPNLITPEIFKPDVIAPGLNMLAAWTGAAAPSGLEVEKRRVAFNIRSGTSMSCPHVSGLAAMLRKAHPTWSPAAIKSALMTTAYNADNAGKQITDQASGNISTPFEHSAGHVDPNKALNPGLIYDILPSDYVAFLCSIGYNRKQMSLFIKDMKVDCRLNKLAAGPDDLNYPSFSVVFNSSNDNSVVKYKRVVTNVGRLGVTTYRVKVNSPPSVKISVSPSLLVFISINQKLSYEVTFTSLNNDAEMEFGAIEWNNGVHVVRSPVAITWQASTTSLISSF